MIRQSRLYQVGSRPSSDMAEILCNPSWAHGGQSPFAPRGQQSSVITNGCLFMFQIPADMSARVDSVTSRWSHAKNRVPQRFGGWQFRWNLSWQNFPTLKKPFPLEPFMSRLEVNSMFSRSRLPELNLSGRRAWNLKFWQGEFFTGLPCDDRLLTLSHVTVIKTHWDAKLVHCRPIQTIRLASSKPKSRSLSDFCPPCIKYNSAA